MAKRYTPAQKQKVIDFMKKEGRGGITKANKKFKISMATLVKWAKGTMAPAGKRGRKPSSAPTLKKIAKLMKDIDKAQAKIQAQEAIIEQKKKQILSLV